MFTMNAPQRRWIMIGFVVLLLAGTAYIFKDSLWTIVQSLQIKNVNDARETKQLMSDMGTMRGASSGEMEPSQVSAMVPSARQQLIGVKTALVGIHPLQTAIRAVGKVDYDEQRITHVNLRLTGWVEDLFVDYTGQLVRQGQPLFTLYSQELVAAQEEYLLAFRARADIQESPLFEVREQGNQLLKAARDRLRLWTITDNQIEDLTRRGTPQTYVTIYSPSTGFVVDKKVFKGMYIKPEMTVYTIADLSTVWVHAEVFEYEMPFIHVGQSGILTLDAYSDETFHGDITYIYPYLNPKTRTVKVRLVFHNPMLRLKPDMYGTVRIQVDRGSRLAVPEEAVLDSGKRKMVFVVRGEGMFEPREVIVGPKVGSYYEIVAGLKQGERIVTSGTFLLDSESKLMASTNMMGALGMGGVKMEQAHMGKMDMPGMDMGKGQPITQPEPAAAKSIAAGTIEKTSGELTLVFSTDPAPVRIGENRIHVTVTDLDGKPVSTAQVQLMFTMPIPGMRPATVPMTPKTQGTYETTVNLGMAGQWDLTIMIQRAGHPDFQEMFSVVAGGRNMSSMPGM